MQWNVAGSVFLADVTALAFLVAFAADRLGRRGGKIPRTAAVLIVFFGAFLLVDLIGFFNLETRRRSTSSARGSASG